jgi:GrpB-like predicted nucleotidyltransferase (UPF0157 family)
MTEDTVSFDHEPVRIVDYDPRWADLFRAELALLTHLRGAPFIDIEHIGSTAVPGLGAKPVIDIMASVNSLEDAERLAPALAGVGYRSLVTDFRKRRFFRKQIDGSAAAHLHVIPVKAWPMQHERIFRDWLCENPGAAKAYAALKHDLALRHGEDRAAYTRAKSPFIQRLVNKARQARGLPPQTDWDE